MGFSPQLLSKTKTLLNFAAEGIIPENPIKIEGRGLEPFAEETITNFEQPDCGYASSKSHSTNLD